MIKRISVFILFIISFCEVGHSENTPAVIDEFYSSMKRLKELKGDEKELLTYAIKECFSEVRRDDPEGFSGPPLFFDNEPITSNLYIENFASDMDLTIISYALAKNTTAVYKLPSNSYSKSTDRIITSTVSVTYKSRTQSSYKRNEYIAVCNNKISDLSDRPISFEDPVSLTIRAAELYTQKKYKAAFETFEKITQIDSDNESGLLQNSFYRLGIMTAQGRGVKKNNDLAIDYLYKASHVVYRPNMFGYQYDKIKDAIYQLTHPQII